MLLVTFSLLTLSHTESELYRCLLGQRLSLSEQLTAFIMLELPFYGLLPGAVPFIYFIGKLHPLIIMRTCQ